MQTIALVSQKGGSGKTTLAIHLCVEVSSRGRKCLIIDLDPQASAAAWGDRRGDLGPDVVTEHPARLDAALSAALAQGYDVVFLDTAPHADQAALRAARASDLVLIPCRPAMFDVAAIRSTLDLCDLAKRPATVVLNAAPIRSKVVDAARSEIGSDIVSEIIVHNRVAFQHCLMTGRVAAEFEPNGNAAAEIASLCVNVGLTTS